MKSRNVQLALFLLVVFTGTIKTLITQVTLNVAIVHPHSMILVAANYVGQYGFGKWMHQHHHDAASDRVSSSFNSSTRSYLIIIALLDVVGGACAMLATIHIGSGLYQILYSSFLVITALLSYLILGTRLTWHQIACILFITYGLIIASQSIQNNDTTFHIHTIMGITLTMICTIAYAVQSVICELMNRREHVTKVSASSMNCAIGAYGSIASLSYILLYTLPSWHDLVTVPMQASALVGWQIIGLLMMFFTINVGHRFTYWYVVDKIGSIRCGVANAVRTVCVFLSSALLFCDSSSSSSSSTSDLTTPTDVQCLTRNKLASCIIVMCGTVAYQAAPTATVSKSTTTSTPTSTSTSTFLAHPSLESESESLPLPNLSSVRARGVNTPPQPQAQPHAQHELVR